MYLEPTETSLRPKKVVLFPEIGRMKFFYRSPVRIVECTSEYTFLVSKNNEQTSKKKNKTQTKEAKRNFLVSFPEIRVFFFFDLMEFFSENS